MKEPTMRAYTAYILLFLRRLLRKVANLLHDTGKVLFKHAFWRVLAIVCVTMFAIITLIVSYEYLHNEYVTYNIPSEYEKKMLSSDISFQPPFENQLGYTYDERTREKVLTGLRWVCTSGEDSLAVFCKGGKRGYLNVNNGQEVIPARYDKAWIFSEGIAAVMEQDSLYYIDNTGKRIVGRGFKLPFRYGDSHIFHNGSAEVKLNDKFGRIDRTGRLIVPCEFDAVHDGYKHCWPVRKGDKWGVYNDSGWVVLPCEYKTAKITVEHGIYLSDEKNHFRRYDYSGKVLDDFVVTDARPIRYEEDTHSLEHVTVPRESNCLMYTVPDAHVGLMSKSGHPLTDAIFYSIEGKGKDLFLCHYEDFNIEGENGVLMNSKGEILQNP